MDSTLIGEMEHHKERGGLLLLTTVVGSLTLAGASLLPLHSSDHIPVTLGAWLTTLGLFFFVSLFTLVNHVALHTEVGHNLRKKYQLTLGDAMDISNKIVSTVQASLSCLTGVVVCSWSCTRDFLHTSHFMSEAYAWFGAAYFFYDVWAMYKVYIVTAGNAAKSRWALIKSYLLSQPIILIHHLFIGSFGFLVIVYLRGGLGDCVFGFVYLMELSTPFVSIRAILSKLKMKSSFLYLINGFTMLVTFFVCRVTMFPFVMYIYSELIDKPFFEAINSLPTGCKIGMSILVFPQVYWFILMAKGALGFLIKPSADYRNLDATSS